MVVVGNRSPLSTGSEGEAEAVMRGSCSMAIDAAMPCLHPRVASPTDLIESMNLSLTPNNWKICGGLTPAPWPTPLRPFTTPSAQRGFCTIPACIASFRHLAPMLGYAATIKIRGSAPPASPAAYPDRHRVVGLYQFAANAARGCRAGRIDHPGRPRFALGAVHINILRRSTVSARSPTAPCATSGGGKLGFQLFTGSVSVSHAYVHIVEFGTPVEVGGLKIHSGDLIHGDLHGVQSIPLDLAAENSRSGGSESSPRNRN